MRNVVGTKLSSCVKCWSFEPLLLAFLFVGCPAELDSGPRCPTERDVTQQCGQPSCHPSALLQRAALLKPHGDLANVKSEASHWHFDHNGFEWSGLLEMDASNKVDSQLLDGVRVPSAATSLPSGAPLLSSLSHTGRRSSSVEGRAITFITVHDPFFATNLGNSSIWLTRRTLPHEWLLLDNSENSNISNLYYRAQSVAAHDLLVFLHPDVILPEEWYQNFMQKLDKIEAIDPDWGVLGTAGVPRDWNSNSSFPPRVASCITDCLTTYKTGVDSLPVQALDESLLVLRRNTSVNFDAHLPGFDLYGMDIVQTARYEGMVSYLLNLPIRHKTVDVDGTIYNMSAFREKVLSPEYMARLSYSSQYFRNKWCDSGFLPVYGTSFGAGQPSLPCQ